MCVSFKELASPETHTFTGWLTELGQYVLPKDTNPKVRDLDIVQIKLTKDGNVLLREMVSVTPS